MEENKLTVFYFKTSGNIYGIWSGSKDFSVFNEDSSAYTELMNYIVLDVADVPIDLSRVKVVDGQFQAK